jgi:type IV pilus assembly protein PilB
MLDEHLKSAIINQQPPHVIRKTSIDQCGLVTLLEDGIVKAAKGVTTLDEVLRCLPYVHQPRALDELKRITGE